MQKKKDNLDKAILVETSHNEFFMKMISLINQPCFIRTFALHHSKSNIECPCIASLFNANAK